MKKALHQKKSFSAWGIMLLILILSGSGCKKYDAAPLRASSQTSTDMSLGGFREVNLVSDISSIHALHIDHNLHNAWGMSANDEGEIWVSAADGGVSFVYDKKGAHIMPPVIIPSHEKNVRGNPTGNIYNETETDFVIPGTDAPAEFLFASEDGTVSAWNDPLGRIAKVVVDRSSRGASYKGIAIATDQGNNYLYVTNFGQKKIDVFDKNFQYIRSKNFIDPDLPAGYAPFGIRNIDDMLYITYALTTADGEEDSTGAGLGIVDVFRPDGSLEQRFASHGSLNAPWGIAAAKPGFCGDHTILIGNFGDGHINVFDTKGHFRGQLMNGNFPVTIDGLWAINNDIAGTSPGQLYFTAGPNDEADGLFGFLQKQ